MQSIHTWGYVLGEGASGCEQKNIAPKLTISRGENQLFALGVNTYGLFPKCEVKMAGKCVFIDQDGFKVHKPAEKTLANSQPSWPNKLSQLRIWDMGFEESCKTHGVVLDRQDSFILAAQVTNHRAEFGSSYPLTEQAI